MSVLFLLINSSKKETETSYAKKHLKKTGLSPRNAKDLVYGHCVVKNELEL